jgi:hypothetical protein
MDVSHPDNDHMGGSRIPAEGKPKNLRLTHKPEPARPPSIASRILAAASTEELEKILEETKGFTPSSKTRRHWDTVAATRRKALSEIDKVVDRIAAPVSPDIKA